MSKIVEKFQDKLREKKHTKKHEHPISGKQSVFQDFIRLEKSFSVLQELYPNQKLTFAIISFWVKIQYKGYIQFY